MRATAKSEDDKCTVAVAYKNAKTNRNAGVIYTGNVIITHEINGIYCASTRGSVDKNDHTLLVASSLVCVSSMRS